jgi:hypothetical protein
MKRMLASLLAVAVFVCTAQPMFADKDREYQDGELLKETVNETTHVHVWIDQYGKETARYPTHKTKDLSLVVRVGDMTYVGTTESVSLNPFMKKGNWTTGTVKVRFERKSSMGVSVTFMYVQRQGENGELKTRIIDIFDEKGKNHCGLAKC